MADADPAGTGTISLQGLVSNVRSWQKMLSDFYEEVVSGCNGDVECKLDAMF